MTSNLITFDLGGLMSHLSALQGQLSDIRLKMQH